MTAVVVGAGISGLACARALHDAGIAVRVLDRGRVVGGRMASRTLRDTDTACDGRIVDIGASYLTAREEGFAALVDEACAAGILRPWTDTFHVADPSGITGVRTGPMRYASAGGLRSFPTWLASGLQADGVTITHDHGVELVSAADGSVQVDGDPVTGAAVCMPDPQAERLLEPGLFDPTPVVWEPVIAVTAVFDEHCWPEVDGVFVNDHPVITWIADDGARRGDGAPVLVAHVNPVLAAGHLEDPAAVLPAAVAAVTQVLDLAAQPSWVDAKRWTFARPLTARTEPFALHPTLPVGLAGDAWHDGPRVETAWLSGRALGEALAQRI